MKVLCTLAFVAVASALQAQDLPAEVRNPDIDYVAFQKVVTDTAEVRRTRLLTEDQFLQAMKEKGVVVLDARSPDRFAMRHVEGAVNLSLPDFADAPLAKVVPAKDTKILIYCNNNFLGSPEAMITKAPTASLNLSTFTNLRSYGYTNVWELGPRLDVRTTKIPFVGTEVKAKQAVAK